MKFDLEEMAKAGLHFGHNISKVHPKMLPYIFGARSALHIIDLEKTVEKLKEALSFVEQLASEGKTLLLVGTKIQLKDMIKTLGQELGLPYVSERWIGGAFTNFGTVKKRVDYFKELEAKKVTGELQKYTKKERLEFDKKLKDLETKFGGIKNLEKLPDAIFTTDISQDLLAIKEAKQKGIKIISIAHTNVNPALVDYPIPANDDSVSSVKYILDKIKEAWQTSTK